MNPGLERRLKHLKQRARHPPNKYIAECRAEWEAPTLQLIKGSARKDEVYCTFAIEMGGYNI